MRVGVIFDGCTRTLTTSISSPLSTHLKTHRNSASREEAGVYDSAIWIYGSRYALSIPAFSQWSTITIYHLFLCYTFSGSIFVEIMSYLEGITKATNIHGNIDEQGLETENHVVK